MPLLVVGNQGEKALDVVRSIFSTELTNFSDGIDLLAADLVFLSSAGRLYLGPNGMVRWYRDTLSEAQNSGLSGGRFEALSEELVLVLGDVSRALRSGSEDRQPTAWLARVVDGKLAAVLCYRLEDDARAAVANLGDCSGVAGLTSSFVMRDRTGRIAMNTPGRSSAEAAASEVAEGFAGDDFEDLGEGYGLIHPRRADDPDAVAEKGVWLVLARDGELGAAFEFADHATAKAALPVSMYTPSAGELVESALYAFISGDSTRVLPLLAPDFTYTDRQAGIELSGAVTVMNGLLLAQERARTTGLPGLEIDARGDGTARVSGLITDSESPEVGARWVTILAVENGRLKWAERQPNEPA
jgi:hypothetical protein